jgi:tyrosinase
MTEARYDAPPYNERSGRPPSTSASFRNRLEGWLTRQGDPPGPGLHNRVHTWIGGDMLFGTSPNDPVFFLNHCNVDRIWAEWQEATGIGYEPVSAGPPGHNLNDQLRFVDPAGPGMPAITPGGSLDFRALGYSYDTLPDPGPGQPEPNVELTVGAPVLQAAIGTAGEVDRYRFTVPALGRFVVETQGATDVVMSIHGPNSDLPAALVAEDDDSGPGTNPRIERTLSAGAYFVRVRHFSPQGMGSYGISVRTTPGGQTPSIPEIAVNGAPVAGAIDGNAESDLYRFRATTAAAYLIETGGTTDVFVTLFGPDTQTAQLAFDDDSGPGTNSRIVATLGIGDYFVRVRHFSPNGRGAYTVSVRR